MTRHSIPVEGSVLSIMTNTCNNESPVAMVSLREEDVKGPLCKI